MNLADPATLKPFLQRHGLQAAKGLGQHFLVSRKVVDKIVGALDGLPGLLEIGPGPGVLTSPLAEDCQKMIALELDERMVAALAESAPTVEVRQADALKASLNAILQELPQPRGVVSNLPYYITGPLLTRIAEARSSYAKAVLMMQKEVAERVLAKPRTPARGSLSVFLQSQFEIALLAHAPAGAFLPPPKVDSAVLVFVPKTLPVPPVEEKPWFHLIRIGFAQPRKTLVNNLVAGLRLPREEAAQAVDQAGLAETARPQELSMEEWLRLHATLQAPRP